MFVNFPSIDPLQWHPFSISSSPEEDEVEFHIRGLGNWTKKLVSKGTIIKNITRYNNENNHLKSLSADTLPRLLIVVYLLLPSSPQGPNDPI